MAKVLVVDDDADVLATLVTIVKSAGHDVLAAKDGIAALDVLDRTAELDLLITDVVMPGLNGFNLVRMARMRRPRLRVLFLTGFHDLAMAMHDPGKEYGKLLRKPVTPAELRRHIDEALAGLGGAAEPRLSADGPTLF